MALKKMNKEFRSAYVVLESSKKHNRSIKNMEKLNKSIDWNRDGMEKNEHFITLDIISKKIIYILLSIVIFLIIACVSTQAIRFFLLNPDIHQFSEFNMDAEANIPTYFSTMILFFSGVLIGMIALLKKKEGDSFALHWIILSFIFFALSLDEAAAIHEMSIKPLRTLLDATGFFYYAWIIPAAILVGVFAIIFFKFWLHLEYRIRILFFLAAVCYIFGAIGFEGIGGYYLSSNIKIDFTYILITTAEETFEMIGSVLFIYALLRYLVLSYQKACIRLTFK
jgi:hypothetical protein